MKRYIKASANEIHLADLISSIDSIIIVPDASLVGSEEVFGSTDIDYTLYTDDYIKNLSTDEIHELDNEILIWLNEDKVDLLTVEQKAAVADTLNVKVVADASDVESVLQYMKDCKDVTKTRSKKNRQFDKTFDLTEKEVLQVIKNLKLSDYVADLTSVVHGHTGDPLIVFMPTIKVKRSSGIIQKNLLMYVKIDLSETLDDGSTVAIVSFHEAEKDAVWYPYKHHK